MLFDFLISHMHKNTRIKLSTFFNTIPKILHYVIHLHRNIIGLELEIILYFVENRLLCKLLFQLIQIYKSCLFRFKNRIDPSFSNFHDLINHSHSLCIVALPYFVLFTHIDGEGQRYQLL